MDVTVEESLPPTTPQAFPDVSLLALYDVLIDQDETLVTDPNNDTVSFDIHQNFTGAWYTATPASMLVSGIPTNSDVGNFTIIFRIYDAYTRESNYSMNLEIKTNHPPENATGTQIFDIFALQPFSTDINPIFNEIDSEALTWNLSSVPTDLTWLSVDNATGLMSGTPPQPGGVYNQSLFLNAYDPKLLTDSIDFYFNVKINYSPYLTGVPTQYIY